MLNYVLIDDDEKHLNILAERLKQVSTELGIPAKTVLMTANFQDVLKYAQDYQDDSVFFVDIELEQEANGIDLCKEIRKRRPDAYLVYVSAYQQYALECCRSHVFDFLLKPLLPEHLKACLQAIAQDIQYRKTGTLLEIHFGTKLLRLRQEEILYFTKERTNLIAVCQNGKTFTWRESFATLLPRIQADLFVQSHKSYIISIRSIQEIRWAEDVIILQNGSRLPLSRRKSSELRNLMIGEKA